jgi:hypothetical protein
MGRGFREGRVAAARWAVWHGEGRRAGGEGRGREDGRREGGGKMGGKGGGR